MRFSPPCTYSSSGLKRSELKYFWKGYASHRRKIEANSKVGEELISRMMLSDLAKRFIIQRELQIANRFFRTFLFSHIFF
ncbi:hypothetical protein Y032_0037g3474 [Ancylostoma ceylanicum]|uniref:Uncharacterized protein n=1 Tax=Ancylostoma ceylanicum TaxID=53326 RepID=A0A016UJH1_9BILA|nr:hypothetical protein Y032_0037g3474 [Ancylostoma ceylanicum]